MSTEPHHPVEGADSATRVVRVSPDQLPLNHHGHRVAPLTAGGRPYPLCWTDPGQGDLVYAETADDLLDYWIPGYLAQDLAGRALLRAQHAVQVRTQLVAELAVEADHRGITLTPDEERILLIDLAEMPDLDRWDSPVPLVLLEGMYRPYSTRTPPLSGLDGDVHDPRNIIWLRNAHPDAYVRSLAHAGVIQLDTQ